jgi:hypothetical protein
MALGPDYFDGINFDRHWEEEDWERFFDAQDRLTSDRRRRVGNPSERPSVDPGLSFRRVMHQFGMDPDNPESPPRPFALDHVLGPDGAAGLPFGIPAPIPNDCLYFFKPRNIFARCPNWWRSVTPRRLPNHTRALRIDSFKNCCPKLKITPVPSPVWWLWGIAPGMIRSEPREILSVADGVWKRRRCV